MKVLLYFQDQDRMKKSGIGRALRHQMKALESAGIEFTLDPDDTYDLAHINTYFGKSQRVLKRCRKRGIPVVVHGHSTFEDFRDSFRAWRLIEPYYDRCLRKMYSAADLIVSPTPYSKTLIAGYDFVSCPVIDLTNGISLDEYAPNSDSVSAYKKYFDIIPGQHVVIGIGWFFHRKGLDDFIEVARRLPSYKFIWFGHQPRYQTEGRMLKAIKNRPSNVIMPGYIDGAVIKGALQSADLMFFPSYEETEGIVVLEAMASHLPILVRDIGVYRPWLTDKVNCYMGSDNDDFTDLIPSIIADEGKSEIIACAYEDVKLKNLGYVGEELKKIYLEAIKEFNRKKGIL